MQFSMRTSCPINHVCRQSRILSFGSLWTKYERVTMPDASDPFLAPNWKLGDTKCFIFLTFYNLMWFWELSIPFREYLMPSPVIKVAWFHLTSGQLSFSRLLNPDWSIQFNSVLGAPSRIKVSRWFNNRYSATSDSFKVFKKKRENVPKWQDEIDFYDDLRIKWDWMKYKTREKSISYSKLKAK